MKKLFSLKSCKQPVSVAYAFKGETNKMPFVIGCVQICFQPDLHVSVTSLYFARICVILSSTTWILNFFFLSV